MERELLQRKIEGRWQCNEKGDGGVRLVAETGKAVTSRWWQKSTTIERDGNEPKGDKRLESAVEEGGMHFFQTFGTEEEMNTYRLCASAPWSHRVRSEHLQKLSSSSSLD
jgi:hypothetical protein